MCLLKNPNQLVCLKAHIKTRWENCKSWKTLNAQHYGTTTLQLQKASDTVKYTTKLQRTKNKYLIKGACGYLKPYKLQFCIVSCTQATCKLNPYAAYN